MITLWDLLAPKRPARPSRTRAGGAAVLDRPPAKPAHAAGPSNSTTARPSGSQKPRLANRTKGAPEPGSAQDRYERMTRAMLDRYGVRVRKWRSGMSGVAWEVSYRDGCVSRLIEAPKPKGPMSAAVFLHEIGHHAIGFHTYTPRCLEEYHAWRYALEQMEAWDLNITERVRERMHDSLHYAVMKAKRRGLKRLPVELLAFEHARPKPPRSA